MFREASAWDGVPGPGLGARLAEMTGAPGDDPDAHGAARLLYTAARAGFHVHVPEPAHDGQDQPDLANLANLANLADPPDLPDLPDPPDRHDLADLPNAELIEVIAAAEAQLAWTAGVQVLAIAEFARRQPGHQSGPGAEFTADQIGPALTLTRFAAGQRVNLAEMACGNHPELVDGMLNGTISLAKAQIIRDQTLILGDDVTGRVVDHILPHVPGWTTGQLRHHLAQAILRIDPEGAAARAEAAKKDRDVFLRRGDHGNATLQALMDAYDAAAVYEIIDRAAHTAHTPGDDRNLGQLRTDVLVDLILGRPNPGHHGQGASGSEASQPAESSPASPASRAAASRIKPAATTDPTTQPHEGARPNHAAPASQPAGATPASAMPPPEASPTPSTPSQPRDPAAAPTAAPEPEPAPAPAPRPAPATAGGDSGRGGTVGSMINILVPLGTLALLLPNALPATGSTGTGLRSRDQRAGSEQPGFIQGLGGIPAPAIRELLTGLLAGTRGTADKIGWRVIACDDTTGTPHAIGHTRYRPPPALQELVKLRDQTCRFPGCRQPAVRCDVDHARAHENGNGGLTCDCNLHNLCRHHHRLKQQPGWTVTLEHGVSTWTSPTGHTYVSTPQPEWADPTCSGNLFDGSFDSRGALDDIDDRDDRDDAATTRWEPLAPENVAWLGRTPPPSPATGEADVDEPTGSTPCTPGKPNPLTHHNCDAWCADAEPPY